MITSEQDARLVRWALSLALAVQALGTVAMCLSHWSDFAAVVLAIEGLFTALCAVTLYATRAPRTAGTSQTGDSHGRHDG